LFKKSNQSGSEIVSEEECINTRVAVIWFHFLLVRQVSFNDRATSDHLKKWACDHDKFFLSAAQAAVFCDLLLYDGVWIEENVGLFVVFSVVLAVPSQERRNWDFFSLLSFSPWSAHFSRSKNEERWKQIDIETQRLCFVFISWMHGSFNVSSEEAKPLQGFGVVSR
jgi:hypothetical protein